MAHPPSKAAKETASSVAAEIDALFASRPRKTTPSASAPAPAPTIPPEPRPTRREKDAFGDIRGMGKARPLTEDGLPIFTAEEMGIGKGGDTADCPFDCDCCF